MDHTTNSPDIPDQHGLIERAWQEMGRREPPREPIPGAAEFPGYTILDQIHRGGQGVVYRAWQESTNRTVALKVILGGALAGANERIRFAREVHVLAELRHPNIVTIHDSGVIGDTQYFVMDYIQGRPLDRYATDLSLPQRERLRLFAKVCEAVNAAHLRGVIHRDLKPGNIRVDEDGEPRVLDFGLAKVVRPAEDGSSALDMTLTGQFVGSLPWASPEQAQGRPDAVDLRTDVYSLGVILYQLLTGGFPYPVAGRIDEVVRHIAETSPTRPTSMGRPIGNELETIVLKCLAKEPERRYQSAGELARDVRRYLLGEPIEAKADSFAYLLRKQIRRHWIAVSVAAAFVLLLAGSLVTSLTLWRQAEQALVQKEEQRREADKQRSNALENVETTEAMYRYLSEMLAGARRASEKGRADVTVREMLDRAAAQIEAGPIQHPAVEAGVRGVIGRTYFSLGLFDTAETHLRRALELREKSDAKGLRALEALWDLAKLYWAADRLSAAEPLVLRAVALEERIRPENLAFAYNNLGSLLLYQRRAAEAETYFLRSLELRRRESPVDVPEIAQALNNLAQAANYRGDHRAAKAYAEESIELFESHWGPGHRSTLLPLGGLAAAFSGLGDLKESEAVSRQLLEAERKLKGDRHPDISGTLARLGRTLLEKGDAVEAEGVYREAVAIAEAGYGPTGLRTRTYIGALGETLLAQERAAQAEAQFARAVELARAVPADQEASLGGFLAWLATSIAAQGRLPEAEALALEAVTYCQEHLPAGSWRIGRAESVLGNIRVKAGRVEEGVALLLAAWHKQEDSPDAPRALKLQILRRLASIETDAGGVPADEWRARLEALEATTQPAAHTMPSDSSGR